MIPQGTLNKTSQRGIFSLLLSGEIETAEFVNTRSVYCKYAYVYGSNWQQVSGIEEGISSTAQHGTHSNQIVLNTPLEATFTSSSPFKWPQIILTCYGTDSFGNDVIRGYGATFLPSTPGRTIRNVPLFVPQSSTTLQRIIGFFTGRYAEFLDPRIVSIAEGREDKNCTSNSMKSTETTNEHNKLIKMSKQKITRVSTKGSITLNMTIVFKDIKKLGYDVQPQTVSRISEFPIPNFEEHTRPNMRKTNTTETTEADQENQDGNVSPRRIQTINEEELTHLTNDEPSQQEPSQ